LNLASNKPTQLTSVGAVSSICVLASSPNKAAFIYSSLCAPPEIVSLSLDVDDKQQQQQQPTALTRANAALVSALDLPAPRSLSVVGIDSCCLLHNSQQLTFKLLGANGQDMQVWLAMPPRTAVYAAVRRETDDDGDNKKKDGAAIKFPVMLLAHGGPQGCWDDSWHSRWNMQVCLCVCCLFVKKNNLNFFAHSQYRHSKKDMGSKRLCVRCAKLYWQHWLWTGVHRCHQQELGRGGQRLSVGAGSLHRNV
jgi:hypothetical protein